MIRVIYKMFGHCLTSTYSSEPMPSANHQPIESDQFTSVSPKNVAGLTSERDYWGGGGCMENIGAEEI